MKLILLTGCMLMVMACASRPPTSEPLRPSESQRDSPSTSDPVEVARAWLSEGRDNPAVLPQSDEAYGLELDSYVLVRIFAVGVDASVAVFAPAGEPAGMPALHLDLIRDEAGTWRTGQSRWETPRQLWPRM
jgi:hypothetical protein